MASSRTNAGGATAVAVRREGGHVIEMQRQRLLSALCELVAREGLEGASVGRVCKRAGVSRRTFYDLFADREACLLAAFEREARRVCESVLGAYDQRARWRDRVRAGLTAMLVVFDSQPAAARLCVVETPRAGPAVLAYRKRVLDELAAVIDEGRAGSRAGAVPAQLTAQGVVGGALSVIHGRLVEHDPRPLAELVNPLMGMIVLPYLGAAASRRELQALPPVHNGVAGTARTGSEHGGTDPFKDLPIRITFRTARVLATIGEQPRASNRTIGDAAGVSDQGQMSKLLRRLERHGLAENRGEGHAKGEANAWILTPRGQAVQAALGMAGAGRQ